ncbi:MAG TPA: cytochrome c maturation protein CcmE [Acidimicrobiales bacterium]
MDVSPDAGELNLTPRTSGASGPRPRRRWTSAVILAVVLGAAGFVVYQFLSSATVYFCNADEVGAKSDCQAGKRFRLQGTVDAGSVKRNGEIVQAFTVTYNGTTVPVTYQGDPGGIFRENLPVVVEGHMGTDGTFAGDRLLVKHSEQYREKNPDKVKGYPEGTG